MVAKSTSEFSVSLGYILGSSYFMLNCLSLCVYPASRFFFGLKSEAKTINEDNLLGQRREPQILGLIGMSLMFKLIKSASWEEFIAMFFMFSKLGSIIMFAFIDMRYCIFYMVACLILWLVLQ